MYPTLPPPPPPQLLALFPFQSPLRQDQLRPQVQVLSRQRISEWLASRPWPTFVSQWEYYYFFVHLAVEQADYLCLHDLLALRTTDAARLALCRGSVARLGPRLVLLAFQPTRAQRSLRDLSDALAAVRALENELSRALSGHSPMD